MDAGGENLRQKDRFFAIFFLGVCRVSERGVWDILDTKKSVKISALSCGKNASVFRRSRETENV